MPQLLQALYLKMACGLPPGQIHIKMLTTLNLQSQAVYIFLKFHVAHNLLKLEFVIKVNRTSLKLTITMNRLQVGFGFVILNEKRHGVATMIKMPLKHGMVIPLYYAQKIVLKPSKFLLPDVLTMGGWNCMSLLRVANNLMLNILKFQRIAEPLRCV